jgi:hypothetical protein
MLDDTDEQPDREGVLGASAVGVVARPHPRDQQAVDWLPATRPTTNAPRPSPSCP